MDGRDGRDGCFEAGCSGDSDSAESEKARMRGCEKARATTWMAFSPLFHFSLSSDFHFPLSTLASPAPNQSAILTPHSTIVGSASALSQPVRPASLCMCERPASYSTRTVLYSVQSCIRLTLRPTTLARTYHTLYTHTYIARITHYHPVTQHAGMFLAAKGHAERKDRSIVDLEPGAGAGAVGRREGGKREGSSCLSPFTSH